LEELVKAGSPVPSTLTSAPADAGARSSPAASANARSRRRGLAVVRELLGMTFLR
jgi:hypothetical protein